MCFYIGESNAFMISEVHAKQNADLQIRGT